MPDEPKVLTPPVVAPAAPAAPVVPTPAAPTGPVITAEQLVAALKLLPDDQRPYANRDEVVEHNQIARAARDELAELKKDRSQPAAPLVPKTGDERMDAHAQVISDLAAENKQIKLQLAISNSGKQLEPDQLVAIEALAAAQKPDNYDEWLAKTLPMFASKAPPVVNSDGTPAVSGEITPPAAPVATPQVPLPVAMPAPAPHASAFALPENPNQADLATLGAMSREKRQEYMNNWLAKGGTRNPMRSGNR